MDVIYEIPKSASQKIVLGISEFKGQTFADIRVYYEEAGEWRPTKKGLTISPTIWREFVKGIEQLGEEMQEQGLLEDAS